MRVDGCAFLDALTDALARGDRIELRGFGAFKVRHRKARTGRNPRTGEPVEAPLRDVPVFKPSLHLRSRVDRASGVSGMKEPLKAVRGAGSPLRAEREERQEKRRSGATHGDPLAAPIRLSGSARRRGGDALASNHARREVPAE